MARIEARFLDISKDFKPEESIFIHPHVYYRNYDTMHYHNFYELVVVRHGSGQHVTKDGKYAIYPGDVFLIRPGDPHGYSDMRQMELINLLYRPEQLRELIMELAKMPGYSHFFETDPQLTGRYRFKNRISLPPETMMKVNELSMQMFHEQQNRGTGWRFMMKMLFMQILCIISRTFEKHSSESNETQEITLIIRYLNEHYAQKITLETLAARFGKSVPTLSRLFQATLNKSPINYLIHLRLEKAAAALRFTSSSITDISFQCGFSDSNYFSKMFLRQFGISPRDYRKRKKNPTVQLASPFAQTAENND